MTRERGQYNPKGKMNVRLYLPKGTEEQVKSFSKMDAENWYIENPSLFYQKFMPLKTQEKSNEFKSDCLKNFKDAVSNNRELKLNDIVSRCNERINDLITKYTERKYKHKKIPAKTVSRVVVGLGGASVLENSITLHRYGFPYIPASAIKGILASYLTGHPDSKKVFGSRDNKGDVIFLDALPEKYPELDLDVMTPHFGDYYKGDEPPADYLMPNPIPFITVARGEKFIFYFLSKDENLLNKIESEWFEKALGRGVGAKTAIGYGEIEIIRS